ncbi:MAG: DUF6350 family protein [Actinomycetaceae bacterium]|nr:DUF6350 family protein [Actinomycetaceae bacterium]
MREKDEAKDESAFEKWSKKLGRSSESGGSGRKLSEVEARRQARKEAADRVRDRVLEERRREKLEGTERPRQTVEELRRAIQEANERRAAREAQAQHQVSPVEQVSERAGRRNPRIPHELPTERLEPLELQRMLRDGDIEESELEVIAGGVDEAPADSSLPLEETQVSKDTELQGEPEDGEFVDGERVFELPEETRTVTRVPVERKVVVVRPPKGWPMIALSAIEVAVLSWALIVATSLIAFIITAGNPWMLEADWNSAISVGTDIWGLSYGAPLVRGETSFKMIPLGLTIFHVLLARVGLKRAPAQSWQGSLLFVPVYVITVLVLRAFNTTSASVGALLLGSLAVVLVAWLWSLKSWDLGLSELSKAGPYLRGVIDGVWATLALVLTGSIVAIVGIVAAWDRVLGIQEVLNASVFDLIFVWILQVLYWPNIAAWGASWVTGPGIYTASDAIITPSRADVTAIPSIPVFGAFPQTAIGIWVVLIPIVVGGALGAYFVWKRREEDLRDHLIHAGFIALTMLVLTAAWMWLSTGSMGVARMSILGPRWIYSLVFGTLEVGFLAALVHALSHPLLLAKYVAGGKTVKAKTISVAEATSERIRSRGEAKDSIDSDEAAPPAEAEEPADVERSEDELGETAEEEPLESVLDEEPREGKE